MMFKKYKHIHFVGIGGIGMSGIAQVLLNLGYRVSGSDLKKSGVTSGLAKHGAKIMMGHRGENIGDAHVVVVSSAVRNDNPEVVAARMRNIPVVPRAEMLAELMRLKYGIAVAGTHGKTTTTSLIATILAHAGLDPTMVIGGRVNNFRTNARLGKGEFLVAEADESDRSFLKLTPTMAVITNIDPEHMENYKNFDHVKETYVQFANKVPFYGAVIACVDHYEVQHAMAGIDRRIVKYGIGDGDYTAANIRQTGNSLEFDVSFKETKLGKVSLAMPGRHNVLNALAAIAVASELDVPFAKIKKGLSLFKGIERRFQILLNEKGSPMVVTDYAHHPKEIEAVISAAREGWPARRVICVMQPHRFTRLSQLFDEFVRVLTMPDVMLIMPLYSAGEKAIDGISSEKLASAVMNEQAGGKGTLYMEDEKRMFDTIKKMATPDDIIMFLGAGDIWKTAKEFVKIWH